jgi:ATP-dependent phosphofructokinase / diphosphate-dependent phosphofructokinase
VRWRQGADLLFLVPAPPPDGKAGSSPVAARSSGSFFFPGRAFLFTIPAMAKTIGILTGGGDVPGLNPCIKAVALRAMELGFRVIGIRRGWGGLVQYHLEDPEAAASCIQPLTADVVRTIDRSGGTFLHSSRINPAQLQPEELPGFLQSTYGNSGSAVDVTPHVLKVLSALSIDALIPIGGEDTLNYSLRMHREGIPVIAIPQTMDNDVFGTDYCIGFSTAVSRSVEFITQLRSAIGSHERIGVVELFGRNSGETCLISAYLSGVDRAVISEVPFDPDRLARLLADDRKKSPSQYAIMTISEGAQMTEGSRGAEANPYGQSRPGGIGAITAEEIKRRTGLGVIYQQLAYMMRSGPPDSLDRMVAINFGTLAVDLIREGQAGRIVVLREGRYQDENICIITQGVKRVDVETFYDPACYRPKVTSVFGKPMFLY